jgi:non-specific serine/threonine protein kinase
MLKIAINDLGRASMQQALQQQLHLQEALGEDASIIRVHDWQLERTPGFIDFEHAGYNLASWMAEGQLRTMPLPARLRLLLDIADTIAAAHDIGLLHRDLKAENVWITSRWQGFRVRVDFCIPGPRTEDLLVAPGATRAGAHHLAPELRSGHAPTQRSDVFALGLLLCQLAVGDPRRTLEPGWSRDIDSDLGTQILAATEAEPARRTPSVDAFIRQLRELQLPRTRNAAGVRLPANPRRADAGTSSESYGRVLRFKR